MDRPGGLPHWQKRKFEVMAESQNGKATSTPKKELSMEMRLLLAFLLMGAVMFVTPYFFKSVAPTPPVKTASEPASPTGAVSAPNGAATAPAGAPETPPPPED